MKSILTILCFVLTTILLLATVIATPNGASNVTQINSTKLSSSGVVGNNSALAGNVTELNIIGDSVTQTWQGYYGNVSGAIKLGDVAGNTMYNWSLASPTGQVYASNASSVTWESIDCFNISDNTAVTAIETFFGLSVTSADGVNETFSDAINHEQFYANNRDFPAGNCSALKTFNSSGVGAFDEVLLTDGSNVVFTSLLQNNANGFNGRTYDFQMLVLENGHGTDTDTTPYYFWVELA